jgi:hypothetical protein
MTVDRFSAMVALPESLAGDPEAVYDIMENFWLMKLEDEGGTRAPGPLLIGIRFPLFHGDDLPMGFALGPAYREEPANQVRDYRLLPHPAVSSRSHNHVTRDIKPEGQCPACDRYHASRKARGDG